jgi:hypothetical protein
LSNTKPEAATVLVDITAVDEDRLVSCVQSANPEFSGPGFTQGNPEGVEEKDGRLTRVAAFPIGIDPKRFEVALELPEVKAHVKSLLQRYQGRKVASTFPHSIYFLPFWGGGRGQRKL